MWYLLVTTLALLDPSVPHAALQSEVQDLEGWRVLTQSGLGTNEELDKFGETQAVGDFDGDGIDDLAVGAPGEAPGDDPRSGVVFVFKGTREGLRPWLVLDQSELGANEGTDLFGAALAAGDYTGDGIDDLAVGAPQEAPGDDPRSGFVFVFKGTRRGPEAWLGLGQGGIGTHEAGDRFGAALASGDFDEDGRDDLAVGAPGEKLDGTRSGAVFVYRAWPDTLAAWQVLSQGRLGAEEEADLFGSTLVAADFDGDHKADLAVGAPGEKIDDNMRNIRTGHVFLFRGTTKGLRSWHSVGEQGSGLDETGERFGSALAGGDIDGDGRADLAVGAPGTWSRLGAGSGVVHVYRGGADRMVEWVVLDQSGLGAGESGDRFGSALATGDVDEDGLVDLLVGAPGEAPGDDPLAGAVFYFKGSPGGPQPRSVLTQRGMGRNEAGDEFGSSLAAGDFNGKGSSDISVGAPREAPGSDPRSGALFTFRGPDLGWERVAPLGDAVNLAIAGFEESIYAAGVALSGELRMALSSLPAEWTSAAVPSGPPGGLATDVPPILVRKGDKLHVFAEGANSYLYHSSRTGSSGWTTFRRLTSAASVGGRMAVVVTPGQRGRPDVFHVVYRVEGGGVEYLRIAGYSVVGRDAWPDAVAFRMSRDGEPGVALVLLYTDGFVLREATVTNSWSFEVLADLRTGFPRNIHAFSAPVLFDDRYEVAVLERMLNDDVTRTYTDDLRHVSVARSPGPGRIASQQIRSLSPADGPAEPLAELVRYREKLVCLYRHGDRRIRYLRLDNADPARPWVGGGWIGRLENDGPLPVTGFDGRRLLDETDHPWPGHGDDLFAAAVAYGTEGIFALNLSRTIFQLELDRQFAVFDNAKNMTPGRAGRMHLAGLNILRDERPYVSELGYLLWELPNWLVEGRFAALAARLCAAGLWNLETTGGRVTCETETKLPVVLKPTFKPFYSQGVWHPYFEDSKGFWEEVGHYAAIVFGFGDTRALGPNAARARELGIDLGVLERGYRIFGERVGGTIPSGRAPGFTGIGGNYDKTSREHSFLYTVYAYLWRGDQLRTWARQDRSAGDGLLTRKYNWVKDNVFRGIEF